MSPLESTLERLELISRRGEGARRLDAAEALVLLAHIRALMNDRKLNDIALHMEAP